MLLGELVVRQRLLDAALNELRRPREPEVAQLASHSQSLFSRAAATSSAAWIAFSIAATSRILGRGTWLKTLR
jgi:hypothetical protein